MVDGRRAHRARLTALVTALVLLQLQSCCSAFEEEFERAMRAHLASRRGSLNKMLASVEKPQRPKQFENLQQLNRYLEQMKQYYSILSRPRYGRDVSRQLHVEQVEKQAKRGLSA